MAEVPYDRPRLRSCFHYVIEEERVVLVGSGRMVALGSKTLVPVLRTILELMDGTRTVAEIARDARGVDSAVVVRLIERLGRSDLLEEVAGLSTALSDEAVDHHRDQLVFLSHFTDRPYDIVERIMSARIAVVGIGPVRAHVVQSLLDSGAGSVDIVEPEEIGAPPATGSDPMSHSSWAAEPEGDRSRMFLVRSGVDSATRMSLVDSIQGIVRDREFVVVCGPGILTSELEQINESCLRAGTPWMICSHTSTEILVGPIFRSTETACYVCYRSRLLANAPSMADRLMADAYVDANRARSLGGYLSPMCGVVGHLASLAVFETLGGGIMQGTGLYGRQLAINISTWKSELHDVLKLPRCPACSEVSRLPESTPWQ